ncbi:MAG: hypothetical protein FWE28_07380 [Oscillospiraceae bacterium]|nr:hypothetical protein [Oscillospiraceae bacterium]
MAPVQGIRCEIIVTLPLTLRVHRGAAPVFLLLLCETAKKARPAGHDQLAVSAKKTLGGHAERERPRAGRLTISPTKGENQRARDAQGHVPYGRANHSPIT